MPTRLEPAGRSRSWIRNRIYSVSFKRRIWFAFVLLVTLGITAAGSLAYLIAAKEIQRSALRSSQDTVNQSAQIVNERLKNIGVAIRALMFNSSFKSVLFDVQNGDRSNYYRTWTNLQSVFSQVKFNDSMIDSILIATPIGDFYPTSNTRDPASSFYDSEMYARYKELGHGFWTEGHADPFFKDKQNVLSLVVEGVYDSVEMPRSSDVYVVVNVKEDDLLDLFMDNLSAADTRYYWIDSTGQEVLGRGDDEGPALTAAPGFVSRLAEDSTGAFFYEDGGEDVLVNYARLGVKDDWMIVGVQSREVLLSKLNGIQKATTLVIAGFVLLSLFISNRLTYWLLRPLRRLQQLMKRVEDNDLSVRFESPYRDEVSQVGFRFNRMLDEINQLISDVKEREGEKRRAEVQALSAQISPHFFYNTLNTIYCKSVLGENEDASRMILALSQMFQLSLSGGRDLIPLRDELDHVRQYVAIQQTSYESLFECSIDADPEALDWHVPKLILQPLVENSIQHGFQDRTSGGIVRIAARRTDEGLRLTVEDNGAGLDPDKAKSGLATPPAGRKGYALRNIYRRMQLYYGDGMGMDIANNESGGARIELRLPRMPEGG
ncbi:sensor histidine kinase [Cohnella xylanilytica]|uniref:Sensor histidine kinase n=1 Tax=Cohnella xylanilytica TaxID=557555 RepID=A0A841U6T0_9BACL|nr:sensor histidine kinase [Cohnella xylanilytica]MBB6695559.1 sensor histidine kinase [Cohnella xylanilytica]